MSLRAVFYASVVVSVILMACFASFLNPSPSNQKFKQSGSVANAQDILKQWGNAGLTTARRNLAVDWLFIVSYVTMWITGALYLGPRVDAKLHVPALLFAITGIAGALCDVFENLCLRVMLYGNTSEAAAQNCKRIVPFNVGLFMVTALYFIIAAVVSRRLERP